MENSKLISVVEKWRKEVDDNIKSCCHDKEPYHEFNEQRTIFQEILYILKTLDAVKLEMPKKKALKHPYDTSDQNAWQYPIYNSALKELTPLLTKYKLKVEELEKKLAKLHKINGENAESSVMYETWWNREKERAEKAEQALTDIRGKEGVEEIEKLVWNNFFLKESNREGAKLNKIMRANINRVAQAISKMITEGGRG